MPSEAKPKSSRVIELDALRALAAINLMLFHFTHVYSVKYGYSTPLGFEFPWGKYGVQLFFMLSGLVNALTLMKKQDATGFLKARCLRILPCYYIVITLNLVLYSCMPLAQTGQWSWSQLAANLTVMPNLLGFDCLEPVMWTLQVELLFYAILLSLFLKGWLNRPLPAISACLAICLLGCWGIDWVSTRLGAEHWTTGLTWFARQVLLLDYFPLFAVGMLLHEIWRRIGSESPGSHTGWAARLRQHQGSLCGIVASLAVFHLTDHHGHNPVVSLGLVALLTASLFGRLPILRYKPLVFISGVSYMLYLLHDNLGAVFIHWMDHTLHVPPLLCFLACIPATVAISTLATYGLERPITKWLRNRYLPSKASQRQSLWPNQATISQGAGS
jgi:peptidoglycan/LPS O-acetylase OafA/YrhL